MTKKKEVQKKMTIEELEKILESEQNCPIQIMPNGEIQSVKKRRGRPPNVKPLTLQENLGGEYLYGYHHVNSL